MRFVTPKTESQQTLPTPHRVRVRTKTFNQTHGFLLEFAAHLAIKRLPTVLAEHPLPPKLVTIIERLHLHAKYLDEQIGQLERDIARQFSDDDIGQSRLAIPGVGVITASVLASEMGDGKQYR